MATVKNSTINKVSIFVDSNLKHKTQMVVGHTLNWIDEAKLKAKE